MTDGPHIWNFAWGKWIVNANATSQIVDATALQSLRRAEAGPNASFHPLAADPLDGAWTSTAVSAPTLELPAFSQTILIDPAACPNCVSLTGDYDANGAVDQEDYLLWRSAFGTAYIAADGNQNGLVDAADYVVWRDALSNLAASIHVFTDSIALPEPSAFVVSLCGLPWSVLFRQFTHH